MSDTNSDYVSETVKFQKLLYSPMKKRGFLPDNGSEVFVRHIPSEETEYDLLKFFQTVGEVFQIRLMMNEDGTLNRGFGYVTFFDASIAKKAVTALTLLPYKGTHYLTIESSLNNCRLFIGGIPTYKRKDQVWQELSSKGVKNIIDVIMYRSYSDRAENRGFVFVEFRTHEEAAHFRAKFGKSLRLWDGPVVVDWSVPIPQVDEAVMGTVKIVYLRNLDVCQTREELQTIILKFTSKCTIEKVYKFKNYAFIHLTTRQYAERLIEDLKVHYKDTPVEVTWAKPPNKFTTQDYRHSKVSHLSSYSYMKNFENGSPQKKLNSCQCSCCKSSKSFQGKATSQPNLSRVSSSSSISSPTKRAIRSMSSPYDSFCRELFTDMNTIQSPSEFPTNISVNYDARMSLGDLDLVARNGHDFDDLQESISGIEIFDQTVPPRQITLSEIAISLSPESFCGDISPVTNVAQSTPKLLPRSTFPSRTDQLTNFQRNIEEIYGSSSPNTEISPSSSYGHTISLQDFEVVPRNMTLDDIQDFVYDMFD